MSQHHLDYANRQLNVGLGPQFPATSVTDYDIPESEVLAIADDWWFDPEESYCPQGDIPEDLNGRIRHGVMHADDGRVYIFGDNGDSWFFFRLSKRPAKWSGTPYPADPDNFWVDDFTGELVNTSTGERSLMPTEQQA